MSQGGHGIDGDANERENRGGVSPRFSEIQDDNGGEEKTNDGKVSCSDKWVTVEDCDQNPDVSSKEGEEDPGLVKFFHKWQGVAFLILPCRVSARIGKPGDRGKGRCETAPKQSGRSGNMEHVNTSLSWRLMILR